MDVVLALLKDHWGKILGMIASAFPLKKIWEWWWTNQSAARLQMRIKELDAKNAENALRAQELEDRKRKESLPKTYGQQLCPICGKQGKKNSGIIASHGRATNNMCWFQCDSCQDSWMVYF